MWCPNWFHVGHFQALVCLQLCLQVSLQLAGALDALVFGRGVEQLTGLLVDELPEVLEGDVVPTLDLHVLQDLTQALLVLHRLQTGSRESVGRSQLEPLREHDLRHKTL